MKDSDTHSTGTNSNFSFLSIKTNKVFKIIALQIVKN